MTNHFLVIFSIVLFSVPATAQYNVASLNLDGDVTAWFDQAIGEEHLPIISGSFEEVRDISKLGHKFFESNRWLEIKIRYFDQEYDQLSGLYDVMDDMLLLKHPVYTSYFSQPIKIQQEKIHSFEIGGHLFKYYRRTEAPSSGPGFYDQLYDGDHIKLIAKRKKEARVGTTESQIGYLVIDSYYLMYQGKYTRIKGRRSIIKALISYKKPLRQYIRQNLLQIKTGNDKEMVELLDYCDNLIADR